MDKDKIYTDIVRLAKCHNFKDALTHAITLLTIRNELPKLLGFLIDTYFDVSQFWYRGLTTNTTLLTMFNNLLMLPKRQITRLPQFHEYFASIFVYTLMHKPQHNSPKWIKYISVSGTRLERLLETTLICRESFGESRLVTKYFRNKMTTDTAQLFDSLYHFMRRGDRKTAQLLIKYICSIKDITYDAIPITHTLFQDVKSEHQTDIAWYVWWFLIVYSKRYSENRLYKHHYVYCYELVMCMFNLYKICFSKKSREKRLDILHTLCYLIMSESMLNIDEETLIQDCSSFVENCKYILNDTWPTCKPKTVKQNKTITESMASSSPWTEQNNEKENEHTEQRLRYLDSLIYIT